MEVNSHAPFIEVNDILFPGISITTWSTMWNFSIQFRKMIFVPIEDVIILKEIFENYLKDLYIDINKEIDPAADFLLRFRFVVLNIDKYKLFKGKLSLKKYIEHNMQDILTKLIEKGATDFYYEMFTWSNYYAITLNDIHSQYNNPKKKIKRL